jgi:hypothetical protein
MSWPLWDIVDCGSTLVKLRARSSLFVKAMFTPPHSPLVTETQWRLPRYSPVMSKIYEAEENPFDRLRRASVASEGASSNNATSPSSIWSNTSRPDTSPSSTTSIPYLKMTSVAPMRRPLLTAYTFPNSHYKSFSAFQRPQQLEEVVHESIQPLEYWPLNEQARTFRLHDGFIYTACTRNLPQYQLQRAFDRSNGTQKLNIRRIQPHETRSYSVPALHTAPDRRIQYNDAGTLYSMTSFDMRGQNPDALEGSCQVTSGSSLWGGQWTRIWHVTKCKAQHRDCGYRGTCEPEKHLLFLVKKGVWEDNEGKVVAREERGASGKSTDEKVLEMVDVEAQDRDRRDLAVACWVMRLWIAEELRWEAS